jgi:hypothetical protein
VFTAEAKNGCDGGYETTVIGLHVVLTPLLAGLGSYL